jgi:hypothetical protein
MISLRLPLSILKPGYSIFYKEFPTIRNFIIFLKAQYATDGKNVSLKRRKITQIDFLCMALQRLESLIVLDFVYPRLIERYKLPIMTLHDAVVLPQASAHAFEEEMNRILEELGLDFYPRFTYSNLERETLSCPWQPEGARQPDLGPATAMAS